MNPEIYWGASGVGTELVFYIPGDHILEAIWQLRSGPVKDPEGLSWFCQVTDSFAQLSFNVSTAAHAGLNAPSFTVSGSGSEAPWAEGIPEKAKCPLATPRLDIAGSPLPCEKVCHVFRQRCWPLQLLVQWCVMHRVDRFGCHGQMLARPLAKLLQKRWCSN